MADAAVAPAPKKRAPRKPKSGILPGKLRKARAEPIVAQSQGQVSREEAWLARRQYAEQLYVNMGVDRSLQRVGKEMRERYGAISDRAIASWSSKDNWVQKAEERDKLAASAVLLQANRLIDVANLETPDALELVAKRYLDDLVKAPISIIDTNTARQAISVVKMALELREHLLDPHSQANKAAERERLSSQNTDNSTHIHNEIHVHANPQSKIARRITDAIALLETGIRDEQQAKAPAPLVVVEPIDALDAEFDDVGAGDQNASQPETSPLQAKLEKTSSEPALPVTAEKSFADLLADRKNRSI